MVNIFIIFVFGIVGGNCPMNGEVLTPSPFFLSTSLNSTIMNKGNLKHGLCHTKLYKRYDGIKQRCGNPNNTYYHNYGGRGIKICEEWRRDFRAFYDYVRKLPGYNLSLTLDRIDNDGDYEPGNLRWVDRYTQMQNTRVFSTNTSGHKGVYFDKSTGKWRAIVEYRKKKFHATRVDTKEEAIKARNKLIKDNKLPILYPA